MLRRRRRSSATTRSNTGRRVSFNASTCRPSRMCSPSSGDSSSSKRIRSSGIATPTAWSVARRISSRIVSSEVKAREVLVLSVKSAISRPRGDINPRQSIDVNRRLENQCNAMLGEREMKEARGVLPRRERERWIGEGQQRGQQQRERERESGERKGRRAKDEAPQREREAMIGWSTITRLSLSVCAFLLSTSKYLSPSCSLSLSLSQLHMYCGSIAKTLQLVWKGSHRHDSWKYSSSSSVGGFGVGL